MFDVQGTPLIKKESFLHTHLLVILFFIPESGVFKSGIKVQCMVQLPPPQEPLIPHPQSVYTYRLLLLLPPPPIPVLKFWHFGWKVL